MVAEGEVMSDAGTPSFGGSGEDGYRGWPGRPGGSRDRWCTVEVLDAVEGVAHDLAGLIDDSVRATLRARGALERTLAGHDPKAAQSVASLSAAAGMLEDSAALAHAAMQGATMPLGSPALSRTPPISVGQAVTHAAEVLRPACDEHRIRLGCELSIPAASAAAGPMYMVLLAGVKNAVEAIMRRAGTGGTVMINGWTEDIDITTGERRRMVVVEISDDGEGVGRADYFALGRPNHAGKPAASLAVSRAIVDSLRGSVELRPREGRGAVLRLSFPMMGTVGSGVKTGA